MTIAEMALNMTQELNHPICGALTYSSEDEAWLGTITLSGLEVCRILYDFDMDGLPENLEEDDEDDEDEERESIRLMVMSDGAEPTPAQEATIRRIFADIDAFTATVLDGLLQSFKAYMRGMLCDEDDDIVQAWKDAISKHQLESATGMARMASFDNIAVLSNEKNGEAYISVDLNCAWDFDHGVSLLVHKGRFIVGSSGADFYGREDLAAHLGYLLEHTIE